MSTHTQPRWGTPATDHLTRRDKFFFDQSGRGSIGHNVKLTGGRRPVQNEMRPGRRTLLHVRLSVGLGGTARLGEVLGHDYALVVGVGSPVTSVNDPISPALVKPDQRKRRQGCI